MKYIFKYLIDEYFSILTGNIVINSAALPIYDAEGPSDPLGSYILLGDRNSTQTQAKGRFTSEVTLLVDICIIGDGFGFKDSEDAANQVMSLIHSDANPDLSPDFQVVTTSIQSTNSLTSINKTDNVFRTLIRYRHLVNQI